MIDFEIFKLDPETMRQEKKWLIEEGYIDATEWLIKTHPSFFSEIFSARYINNIYLDSVLHKSYFETVNGLDRRLKVRVRWYGDIFGMVKNPSLEIKLKIGSNMQKISYPLKDFVFGKDFNISVLLRVFDQSHLPEIIRQELKSAELALLNRYNRKYFLTSDQRFRLTLDQGLTVYRLNKYRNKFMNVHVNRKAHILEIKYKSCYAPDADTVTSYFPYRMSKSSKFVMGVDLI